MARCEEQFEGDWGATLGWLDWYTERELIMREEHLTP